MKCTRCGYDNPDNMSTCESCNFDLLSSRETKFGTRPSKLAFLSFVLGMSSLSFHEVAYNPIKAPVNPPATLVDKISPDTIPPPFTYSAPSAE